MYVGQCGRQRPHLTQRAASESICWGVTEGVMADRGQNDGARLSDSRAGEQGGIKIQLGN